MKKKYSVILSPVFLLLVVLLSSSADAQVKAKENLRFKDKIFFGGGLWLTFGSITQVDVMPEVGMWVIPQWAVGMRGRYTYRKERNFFNGESITYESNIWGISGFTQVLPIPDLDEAFNIGIHGGPIFQGEWEALYLDKGDFDPSIANGKGWVHIILVGAGYHIPVGDRAAINIIALWDLTNSKYSPYTSNPILRLSINF